MAASRPLREERSHQGGVHPVARRERLYLLLSGLADERRSFPHQSLRMMLEDPNTELPLDFGQADGLDDLDAAFPQNADAGAVYTRIRVTHGGHDTPQTTLDDGVCAGGSAPMERARLERRVQRGTHDRVPVRCRVFRCGDFRMVLARPACVAQP